MRQYDHVIRTASLAPVTASLESIYQSVPALPKPLIWKDIEEMIREERAWTAASEDRSEMPH